MGVQPPSDDVADEPDVVEFGIAALDAELPDDALSYPVESAAVRRRYGDLSVPVAPSGTEMALSDALERCGRQEFTSRQDLLNALHPVFEERREAVSNSLLGQLRSLVPF